MIKFIIKFSFRGSEYFAEASKVSSTLQETAQWVISDINPKVIGLPIAFDLIHEVGTTTFYVNKYSEVDPKFNDLFNPIIAAIRDSCRRSEVSEY